MFIKTLAVIAVSNILGITNGMIGIMMLQAADEASKSPWWEALGPVGLIASALTLLTMGWLVVPRWVYNASEERNAALNEENKRLTRRIEWMALNYPALMRDVARTTPAGGPGGGNPFMDPFGEENV